MIKLILFDVGGTLTKSDDLVENLLVALDKPGDKKIAEFITFEFDRLYRANNTDSFSTYIEMLQATLKKASTELGVKDISKRAEKIYTATYVDGAKLNIDTLEMLEYAKRKGIRMVIVSDADAPILLACLRRLKIINYFEGFVISSEVRGYKPSQPMILAAHKYCTEDPSQILFVGNSEVDILTAKELGIKSAFVNLAGERSKLADFNIRSLNTLKKIL